MNIDGYPFKTARTIEGKTYIQVDELKEILSSLEKLGPVLKQVADATKQIKDAFSDGKEKTDNLLVELQKTEENARKSLGDI